MRGKILLIVAVSLCGGYALGVGTADVSPKRPVDNGAAITSSATPSIETAFSPDQGATTLVIKTIDHARHEIRLAAYSFTSEPIAEALINAHRRGIDVEAVVDGSNRRAKGSQIGMLQKAGVPVRLNDQYRIMHDKFIIADDDTVELGSFNYTASAEHMNAENVLVIHHDPSTAAHYSQQWEQIWAGGSAD